MNSIFGCVDGGDWVVVSIFIGLIWVWVVVVLLKEENVVVADGLQILMVMVAVVGFYCNLWVCGFGY